MCSNCGIVETYALGRCAPCYRYLRRTGIDRPKSLAERPARPKVCECGFPATKQIQVKITTEDKVEEVTLDVCVVCWGLEMAMAL